MRNLSIKSILTVAAVLAGLGCGWAQSYHTESTVDVKFTGAYTKDNATVTKGNRTTYSSKLQTYRILTRDLIDSYRASGFIPETDGWKLVAITRQGATSYVLRRSGRSDVPVSFLIPLNNGGSAEGRTQVEDSVTGTVSSTVKYQSVKAGEIQAGQIGVTFTGKEVGTQTWRIFKDPADAFYVFSGRTTTIIGTAGGLTTTGAGTVDGSFSFGGEKVIKDN